MAGPTAFDASAIVSGIIDRARLPEISESDVPESRQRLRKALLDIDSGSRQSLRVLTIGDSLATGIWGTVTIQIAMLLVPWLKSTTYYALRAGGSSPGATLGEFHDSSTAVEAGKTEYDIHYIGRRTVHQPGQVSVWSFGGNTINCDRLIFPIVKSPGAGSVKIEIAEASVLSGATYRNPTSGEITSSHSLTGSELIVSADGEPGLELVTLSLSLARRAAKITQVSGGNVKTFRPFFEVRNAAAINMLNMGAGSNDFSDATESSNTYMAPLVKEYDPDLIVIESDDKKSSYENFLPILSDCLDIAGQTPKPTVLLVGNPGIGSGASVSESGLAERIAYCKEYAKTKRWDVIDGLALVGGYSELLSLGWHGDGIHLTPEAWLAVAEAWASSRGYLKRNTPRPGGEAASPIEVISGTSARDVTAENAALLHSVPHTIDSGTMTWSYLTTGSGSGTRNPGAVSLRTGTTPGSTVVAYIDDPNTPLGHDQGRRGLRIPGGFATWVRLPTNQSANAEVWLACMARSRSYNAPYAGPFTTDGVGWKIAGGMIYGACWDSGSLVLTDGTSITSGGQSQWTPLQIVLRPRTINASRGSVDWYVNNVLLGTSNYSHTGVSAPPRVEFTNGTDSNSNQFDFLPFRVVTIL